MPAKPFSRLKEGEIQRYNNLHCSSNFLKDNTLQNFFANERRGLIHRAAYLYTSAGMSSWLRQRDEAGLEVQRAYMSMFSGKGHDLTPSTKLQTVVQILQEILNRDKNSATKRKVLLYCAWPSLWPIVQAHLRHHGIYTMCIAESSSGRRDQLIADFQQRDAHIVEGNKSYVAIISAAVSTGVNLTRASVIIMMVSKQAPFQARSPLFNTCQTGSNMVPSRNCSSSWKSSSPRTKTRCSGP